MVYLNCTYILMECSQVLSTSHHPKMLDVGSEFPSPHMWTLREPFAELSSVFQCLQWKAHCSSEGNNFPAYHALLRFGYHGEKYTPCPSLKHLHAP